MQLVVFDLDGTLIDSRADLCQSVNAMLARYHRPPLDLDTVAGYIGNGAESLVRRTLVHAQLTAGQPDPHDEAFVTEALRYFLDWYNLHKVDETYLYPGVWEALARIRECAPDLLMACLTNKPVHASRAICAHFGLDRFFFQIYGGNSFPTKKPEPEGLLQLIAEAQVRSGRAVMPRNTTMIGDSSVDVLTARACGTRSVGCLFGFAPESLQVVRPDILVSSAAEWPSALGVR